MFGHRKRSPFNVIGYVCESCPINNTHKVDSKNHPAIVELMKMQFIKAVNLYAT